MSWWRAKLAVCALLAILSAQGLAAEKTEPASSAASQPPVQTAQGIAAATKVFGANQTGTDAPASAAHTTPLTQTLETTPATDQATPSVPASATTPETVPDASQPKQAALQTKAQPAAAPPRPAAAPVAKTEPPAIVPFNTGPLPASGSLPRVRSMAEGQAQLARKAAAQVAAQSGFVSVGTALRVVMVYGQSWPTLVCKYNLTCLLELEPGEEIADTHVLADSVRWEAALRYREQPVQQAYIAFKPRPDAEETNFVLVTDRRVYSILLVPDPVVHTPILSFSYPDTEAASMAGRIAAQKRKKRVHAAAASATRKAAVKQSGVSTTRGVVPANELDFNYRITGRAGFKPVRIYTDGRRTYIDLPVRYRGELPVLIASAAKSNAAVNIQVGKNGTQLIADKKLTGFSLVVGRHRIQVRKGN